MTEPAPLLLLRDVTLDVPTASPDPDRAWERVADEVSLALAPGACLVLLGETTSGAAGLARLAAGRVEPHGGHVRRPAAGFLPSETEWDPTRTAGAALSRRARAALPRVGLDPAIARQRLATLDHAQRQRLALARALAAEPALLVAEDPTARLDAPAQAALLNLLRDLQRRDGLALLLTTDNPAIAWHMADTVAVLYLGRIVESGPADQVLLRPLHPYTALLLALAPHLSHPNLAHPLLDADPGPPPDPADPPPGCPFHPRCPLAFLRCKFERPADLLIGLTTVACHAVEEGRLAPEPAVA